MLIGPTTDKVYFMHVDHDWDEFYFWNVVQLLYGLGKTAIAFTFGINLFYTLQDGHCLHYKSHLK